MKPIIKTLKKKNMKKKMIVHQIMQLKNISLSTFVSFFFSADN